MKNKLFIVIALLGLTMLFSSCAKFPQVQLDATTAAVQAAKDAGADVYVPQVYQALTDSLNSANAKAQAESQLFFPSYKKINILLVATADSAVKALVKVDVRKDELKAENNTLVAQVKDLLVINGDLLKKAPKGKDGKAALLAIQSDLEVVATTVTEVETLIVSGDILGANSKIKVANEKVLSIKAELETAIAKVQ